LLWDDVQTLLLTGRLGEDLSRVLLLMSLVSIRMLAFMYVLPPTSSQFIQGGVRGALVVQMSFFIVAGMPADTALPITAVNWFGFAAKEAILGLMLGFAAATVFWVAESVGALIDTQVGYNNVQMTNPMSDQQSTPISTLLIQLMVAVFYLIGGLTALIGVMIESFRIWPPLQVLPSTAMVSEALFIKQMDGMMASVLKIAAPVLIVLSLIDMGMGLITRAADKLEPGSLSQPLKGATAMLMLSLIVGIFVEQTKRYLLPTDLLTRLQSMLQ
jgi:type III secretion protein T